MSLARLEDVATWDEDGTIDGLQFDGRERRIQQWREQKEEEEFKRLVAKLQARNWAREAAKDPVKKDRIREAQKRHQQSGRRQARANALLREQYEANPVVNVCEQCGSQEIVPFDKRGARKSRFCSKTCRNKWHGRRRRRGKGQRDMRLKSRVVCFLSSIEEATAAQIAKAVSGKVSSVRVCLSRWANDQESPVKSDGGKPAKYSITQDSAPC